MALPSGLYFVYYINMKKSKSVVQKKRGRPAREGGPDPIIQVRFPPGLIDQVEAWANAEKTTRSNAIRRLVELGLLSKR